MNSQLASVIIVTRNRKNEVIACLQSVYKMNYPTFEVILVDNASQDDTVSVVKKQFPQVKLIACLQNLGLNAAKNKGQKVAQGKYILFLDSDTIVDKNFLSELIKVAESDPQIGLVCPKMYYFDQKEVIWYAGARVNFLTSQTKNLGCNEKDNGQYDQIRPTSFAPTAYLATQELAKKLKGHEEAFFMTYGDTDYGFRAQAAGFKVMFCPTSKLWHRLGQEENTKSLRALGYNQPLRAYYFSRNRVVFMKRHAPKLNFWIFLIVFFPLMTLYIAYKIIIFKGGRQFLAPHLKGALDGIKYIFTGTLKNHWV